MWQLNDCWPVSGTSLNIQQILISNMYRLLHGLLQTIL